MELELKLAYNLKDEIGKLFSEYTNMLLKEDSTFKKYLDIQNYDEEVENLEQKYGMPEGRLYIAYFNEQLAGCIGLRKIDDENCEMKRLYVRPEFRGNHIGNELVNRIIDDAKEIGYKFMLLDTFPFLENAIHMYKNFGFYEISSYNNSPMDSLIYMKMDLNYEL